jgi:hypothetical protein
VIEIEGAVLKRVDDVRKAAQTLFECRFVRGEGQAYVSLARRAEFGPGAYEHASVGEPLHKFDGGQGAVDTGECVERPERPDDAHRVETVEVPHDQISAVLEGR